MKLHPSQIAQEIKDYPFFKIFKTEILLQLSTMVETKSYAVGDCILIEGQNNNNIYFLRQGVVEVYMGGQKLAELSDAGEVMGEMSVATEKAASTTIVAKNDVEIFSINTDYFSHMRPSDKEKFELLFYKMLCQILSDRLIKENLKNTSLRYL
jgi:signal-transduction protein with cAMP-binding, CBS, and nucleotidyltransferase domain